MKQSGGGRLLIFEQRPYVLKELRWKAKCRASEKGWKCVWYAEGKVLARKIEHSQGIRTATERDLEQIK